MIFNTSHVGLTLIVLCDVLNIMSKNWNCIMIQIHYLTAVEKHLHPCLLIFFFNCLDWIVYTVVSTTLLNVHNIIHRLQLETVWKSCGRTVTLSWCQYIIWQLLKNILQPVNDDVHVQMWLGGSCIDYFSIVWVELFGFPRRVWMWTLLFTACNMIFNSGQMFCLHNNKFSVLYAWFSTHNWIIIVMLMQHLTAGEKRLAGNENDIDIANWLGNPCKLSFKRWKDSKLIEKLSINWPNHKKMLKNSEHPCKKHLETILTSFGICLLLK